MVETDQNKELKKRRGRPRDDLGTADTPRLFNPATDMGGDEHRRPPGRPGLPSPRAPFEDQRARLPRAETPDGRRARTSHSASPTRLRARSRPGDRNIRRRSTSREVRACPRRRSSPRPRAAARSPRSSRHQSPRPSSSHLRCRSCPRRRSGPRRRPRAAVAGHAALGPRTLAAARARGASRRRRGRSCPRSRRPRRDRALPRSSRPEHPAAALLSMVKVGAARPATWCSGARRVATSAVAALPDAGADTTAPAATRAAGAGGGAGTTGQGGVSGDSGDERRRGQRAVRAGMSGGAGTDDGAWIAARRARERAAARARRRSALRARPDFTARRAAADVPVAWARPTRTRRACYGSSSARRPSGSRPQTTRALIFEGAQGREFFPAAREGAAVAYAQVGGGGGGGVAACQRSRDRRVDVRGVSSVLFWSVLTTQAFQQRQLPVPERRREPRRRARDRDEPRPLRRRARLQHPPRASPTFAPGH